MAKNILKLNEQGLVGSNLTDDARIVRALKLGAEWLGKHHVAVKALEIGVAVHHGGLPRQFLAEVERLLKDKVLPIVISSPTLAQGVDLSCGALIFQSIYRAGKPIPGDEFANVIGRAGRAYVDLDGLTVLPVFDNTTARAKHDVFINLIRESKNRQIESGLLQLVEHLGILLANSLKLPSDEVLQYVLNNQTFWDDESLLNNTEHDSHNSYEAVVENEWLLAELDTAILSAVDNLSCTPQEVADLLDAALKSSLWSRRLKRCDENKQLLQLQILHSRAQWIWNNSSAPQRQSFFAAGIGYTAGKYIITHIDELIANLVLADEAFVSGEVKDAVQATTNLAIRLFEAHPFKAKHTCLDWKRALSSWLRGLPLGELIDTCGGGEIEFIQQNVIYRLVWAIEALRVHAHILQREEQHLLSGSTTMALTFGLPSISAAVLVKAGLPSRQMAIQLTDSFPADFTDEQEMRSWIEPLLSSIDPARFWEDPASMAIWSDFSQRWREIISGEWVHTDILYKVEWLPGIEVAPGIQVRIIPQSQSVEIYSKDFHLLGYLIQKLVGGLSANLTATVSTERDFVELHRFGPTNHDFMYQT